MPSLNLTGLVASLWMFAGVWVVARLYPGYSHRRQVMSELGAIGRPTTGFHPWVNNYPIALFYSIFGVTITASYWGNPAGTALGILLSVHALCHLVTGLFPCDEDLGIPTPSKTQVIHNLAGLLMLLSLLCASAMGFISSSIVTFNWFRWLSLLCFAVSVVFLILMAKALEGGRNLGLYQRVSYGALVVWVAVFSGIAYYMASEGV